MQDYQNYHIVYIDDASPDQTGKFVKKYLKDKTSLRKKYKFTQRYQQKGTVQHLPRHPQLLSGRLNRRSD